MRKMQIKTTIGMKQKTKQMRKEELVYTLLISQGSQCEISVEIPQRTEMGAGHDRARL